MIKGLISKALIIAGMCGIVGGRNYHICNTPNKLSENAARCIEIREELEEIIPLKYSHREVFRYFQDLIIEQEKLLPIVAEEISEYNNCRWKQYKGNAFFWLGMISSIIGGLIWTMEDKSKDNKKKEGLEKICDSGINLDVKPEKYDPLSKVYNLRPNSNKGYLRFFEEEPKSKDNSLPLPPLEEVNGFQIDEKELKRKFGSNRYR